MENSHTAICILDKSSVAGTGRIKNLDSIISSLEIGDRLELERDVENYFDDWAIRVMTPSGCRVGYITCEYNELIGRLIDGGVHAFAEFESVNVREGWTDLRIRVMVNV